MQIDNLSPVTYKPGYRHQYPPPRPIPARAEASHIGLKSDKRLLCCSRRVNRPVWLLKFIIPT